MYKQDDIEQISFFDFNQSCGMQLDENNEWIVLANRINWKSLEEPYAALFPSRRGRPAKPVRMALGACIIQKRKNLSDRELVKAIEENPYLQYFIGMSRFEKECPFGATALVEIRKRLTADFINLANEEYLKDAPSSKEHKRDKESVTTAIIDATCSPSNIKYPQDFVLLNDGREKLEEIIDYFHETYAPWKKPRTYRIQARQEYLSVAKAKKRTTKRIRSLIRKQLGCFNRDIRYIEEYLEAGYEMPEKYKTVYETIRKLYEQQKYMFDNKTHSVENRIVSIDQPYLRPIVRGKAKAPVEFGAKYDVSIDENGHARLEKISFDPYNESTIFKDVIERYKARTGRYPERVLVDQIYRTRDNLAYCKAHGIRISGPKLGRPSKDQKQSKADKKIEYQDNTDRIEVERFFSLDKRCNGAGLITTKLEETTLHSVAMSVFVTNLFALAVPDFFVLYFWDGIMVLEYDQFILIDETTKSVV